MQMARKVFDPSTPVPWAGAAGTGPAGRQDHQVYLFDTATEDAVNVALAAQRPLLVFGPPGSGKSSLAPNIARILGFRFYAEIVTARTEAPDLLWREEAFRKLNDASRGMLGSPDDASYYRPGPLWKALDPDKDEDLPAALRDRRAVVLIDEIDKADPDLPNALLDPLDGLRFEGPDRRQVTVRGDIGIPLVVITSNEERELSDAFLRRCIHLRLSHPDRGHLLAVARLHLGADYDAALAGQVADLFLAQHAAASQGPARRPVASTAEFLDTLRACCQLELTAESELWRDVARLTLIKDTAEPTAFI
jgi:MoxR-like ATPase